MSAKTPVKFTTCYICQSILIEVSNKPTIYKKIECKQKIENMIISDYVVRKITANPQMYKLMLDLAKCAVDSPRKNFIMVPFPTSFIDKGERDFDRVQICCQKLLNMWPNVFNKLIKNDQELAKEIGEENYRFLKFIVMSCLFDLEEIFRESDIKIYKINKKDDEFAERKKSHQSKLLYHGSYSENYFSILRNGLKNCSKSKLMIHGNAHGNGIYLTSDLEQSLTYIKGPPFIILIAEALFDNQEFAKINLSKKVYVIEDDKTVIIRYLIVGDSILNIKMI